MRRSKAREHPPHAKLVAFEVGDRVTLSALGKSRSPRAASIGVVTALPKDGRSVQVHFDGNKNPKRIHKSYLDPA
jgi:hypothetical protein